MINYLNTTLEARVPTGVYYEVCTLRQQTSIVAGGSVFSGFGAIRVATDQPAAPGPTLQSTEETRPTAKARWDPRLV